MQKADWISLLYGCVIIVVVMGALQLWSDGKQVSDKQILFTMSCKCPIGRQDQTQQDILQVMSWKSDNSTVSTTTDSSDQKRGRSEPQFKSRDHRTV